MIRITRKLSDKTTRVTEYPDERLPELCLHYCGGGYSVSQTTKALVTRAQVMDKGKARVKNVLIERI